jgi:erythritol kinase
VPHSWPRTSVAKDTVYVQEIGAKGAFIAGLVAMGKAGNFASAAKDHVRIRDVFEAHKERRARYDELFEQFLAIRESTLPIWKRLAEVLGRSAAAAA